MTLLKNIFVGGKGISRNEALKEHTPDDTKKTNNSGVPFIITHNPALPNIHKILHRKRPILHFSDRPSQIFKETPIVAYRRSPNLLDLLVCAKLTNLNTVRHETQPLAHHDFAATKIKN